MLAKFTGFPAPMSLLCLEITAFQVPRLKEIFLQTILFNNLYVVVSELHWEKTQCTWWCSHILLKVPQRHSVFTPGGVLHSNNYLRLLCSSFPFDFSNILTRIEQLTIDSEEPGERCYQIRISTRPSWRKGANSSHSKSNEFKRSIFKMLSFDIDQISFTASNYIKTF